MNELCEHGGRTETCCYCVTAERDKLREKVRKMKAIAAEMAPDGMELQRLRSENESLRNELIRLSRVVSEPDVEIIDAVLAQKEVDHGT